MFTKLSLLIFTALSFFIFTLIRTIHAQEASPHYAVTQTFSIPGPTQWDYLTFDPTTHHLFITRSERVDIFDTLSHSVVGTIDNLQGVHGVALSLELNKGFITEGKANQVAVFDLASLRIIDKIATGQKPDAIIYDAKQKHLFIANGKDNNISVVDAVKDRVIQTIKLQGQPEYMVLDDDGYLYVNLEDKSQIEVIDIKNMKSVSYISLGSTCDSPTGLAIDPVKKRLFSVCGNGVMAIIDIAHQQILATLTIGHRSDAAVFDPQTNLAFSSNGDGTLSVVASDEHDKFNVIQNVSTKVSARTMALDPDSHNIYLSSANTTGMEPPTVGHPEGRPHIDDGTFAILKVSPSP